MHIDREAKWDCLSNADPLILKSSSLEMQSDPDIFGGASFYRFQIRSDNDCGLVPGKDSGKGEYQAYWDCRPEYWFYSTKAKNTCIKKGCTFNGYMGDVMAPTWQSFCHSRVTPEDICGINSRPAPVNAETVSAMFFDAAANNPECPGSRQEAFLDRREKNAAETFIYLFPA